MTVLVLKSLHFLGLIFWTGNLSVFIRNIREPQFQHEIQYNQHSVDQTNLKLYRKWLNPLMMFTWVAGIALIYSQGMGWFETNLWLHQKIMLLIFLTVFQIYAKLIVTRSSTSDRVGPFSRSFIKVFSGYFYYLVSAIIVLAVFKPMSMAFMGTIVFISFSGLGYISYQIFVRR